MGEGQSTCCAAQDMAGVEVVAVDRPGVDGPGGVGHLAACLEDPLVAEPDHDEAISPIGISTVSEAVLGTFGRRWRRLTPAK